MFLIDSFCGFYFHSKELKDPEEVNVVHPLDAQRGISVEDFRLIKLHMSNYISKLAQHIKIRQRVVATAVTYMRRVYTRYGFFGNRCVARGLVI
jgi:cyclin C